MGIKDRLISLGEAPWQHSAVIIRDGKELCVDCCTAVISCTDCSERSGEIVLKIRCSGEDRLLRVCGSGLLLENFGADGVRIIGGIESLAFVAL